MLIFTHILLSRWYYIEQEPHVYHRCFPSDFIPLYALSEMLRVYKAKMAIVEVSGNSYF